MEYNLRYTHSNNTTWIEELEGVITKITWAVNLYSQAGDESNTRKQYRKLADDARAILTNDVSQSLESIRADMEKNEN